MDFSKVLRLSPFVANSRRDNSAMQVSQKMLLILSA
jgi:hypothetical protein